MARLGGVDGDTVTGAAGAADVVGVVGFSGLVLGEAGCGQVE